MGDKIVHRDGDEVVGKVISILENSNGLTITDIVKKTKLNRSSVRIALAKLDGAEKVFVRKIGMAKVYLIHNWEKSARHAHELLGDSAHLKSQDEGTRRQNEKKNKRRNF